MTEDRRRSEASKMPLTPGLDSQRASARATTPAALVDMAPRRARCGVVRGDGSINEGSCWLPADHAIYSGSRMHEVGPEDQVKPRDDDHGYDEFLR